jgi:hypothetical protein
MGVDLMGRSEEDRNYILRAVIPSRLGALDALDAAIRIIERKDPDDPGEFTMFLGGAIVAKGSGYGILNPWREVGLIHKLTGSGSLIRCSKANIKKVSGTIF